MSINESMELSTQGQFSLAPSSLDEAIKFSEMMAVSSFVPNDLKGKPGDILVAVAMGADVGLKPLQAIQNIAVINGRPSIWGDAAIALVKASPLCEGIKESIEEGTSIKIGNKEYDNWVAICTAQRKGKEPETRRFSVQDAVRADLWGKSGTWTKYPKRMLQMRARSWALRDVFADVLSGLNIREETNDFDRAAPEPIAEPEEIKISFDQDEPHDCLKDGHIPSGETGECGICGETDEDDQSTWETDPETGDKIPPEDQDHALTPDSLFPSDVGQ